MLVVIMRARVRVCVQARAHIRIIALLVSTHFMSQFNIAKNNFYVRTNQSRAGIWTRDRMGCSNSVQRAHAHAPIANDASEKENTTITVRLA